MTKHLLDCFLDTAGELDLFDRESEDIQMVFEAILHEHERHPLNQKLTDDEVALVKAYLA